MLALLRILKVWTTSVVGSGLVCLAVPTLSWAVTIGGQVVPLNQTKNQPTLNIQITGVTRPGIGFGRFDKDTWRITASLPWTTSDADPPPYTEADG